MSADRLRRAATQAREMARVQRSISNALESMYGDDCDTSNDAARHEAIADWLEAVAERQKPLHRYNRRSHGWTGSREANAVARAYLGPDA